MKYQEYIASKSDSCPRVGIDHGPLSDVLFEWQAELVSRALKRGRFCLFTDTGTGKTLMQLEWARHIPGRVLILAPLAVAEQTVREGALLGIEPKYLREDDHETQVVVANYEMLSHFDPANFTGIVLDESSILKSFTGKIRTQIIEEFQGTPYRLACTATPAPNDHMELGNHSEFLGEKTRTEMLAEYFVHDGATTQAWRLKGHAEDIFWRWICSWAAFMGKPSDIGYSDAEYQLPELRMHEHVIGVDHVAAQSSGMLFAMQARGLREQRAVRRGTMDRRVDMASKLANHEGQAIVWCELNDESKAAADAIEGSVEITGSDSPDFKRDALLGFANGEYRVLVSKLKIAGFGLNFQNCNKMVFLGASHSFEQTYQGVRRCWRFGQKNPVDVHIIRAETEDEVVANYKRKERQFAEMRQKMVEHTRHALEGARWVEYSPNTSMIIPDWLC
jgi:superfamily II DNA or RNA helicase